MMPNNSAGKREMKSGDEFSPSDPGNENERLTAELSREHEVYLRTLADFDNFRKRVERERAGSARAGKKELVLPLLDVLADFDRSLEHLGDVPDWMSAGFVAIHKRLNSILQTQGIVPYESLGEKFDPARHEAIGLIESRDVEPGTIVAELSRGYCWGDEVLRPARVRVAQ
jgi:molecular chaperone GrpE